MKAFLISVLLALLAACVLAAAPHRSVLISYPKDTPDHIVNQAKDAIVNAGGMITHEYKLIKGFAATAPAKVLESVQVWGAEYNALIEEDMEVHALGSS
ncbi:hypothetical protein K490DRAFT_67391 [Saccharata proteae CBS 121410]|uniref:Proteinase inhibitor, propeptide n=1 Tax=Saccharata proteae CBS 121410 TaxID=1314787 RepID=A0A9P4HQ29_9PEZI|nr:hypothetical protein K490DRAFT_67391 [Saccharata proteae CBS 121410]